jgi:hypothetical protein
MFDSDDRIRPGFGFGGIGSGFGFRPGFGFGRPGFGFGGFGRPGFGFGGFGFPFVAGALTGAAISRPYPYYPYYPYPYYY